MSAGATVGGSELKTYREAFRNLSNSAQGVQRRERERRELQGDHFELVCEFNGLRKEGILVNRQLFIQIVRLIPTSALST